MEALKEAYKRAIHGYEKKAKSYTAVIRQAITIITTLRLEKENLEAKVKRLEYENLTLKSELAEAKVKARAKS